MVVDIPVASCSAPPAPARHGPAFAGLESVSHHYQSGAQPVAALRDVTLAIERGEFLAVWGPSGSGKTTLLNLLGLLDRPTQGRVSVAGTFIENLDDERLADYRNRHIGFVFQNFNLIPVLSALENTMLPVQIQGVPTREARARATRCLADVGLGDLLAVRPDRMSGGQRQRVAVARALVAGPSLVIADEPTANLDSENSFMVIDLMRRLNRSRQVTFVFATHDARLLELVDRRVLLKDGRVAADERQARS